MAQHLTQAWLDQRREGLASLALNKGPTVAVEVLVSKGPDGDVRFLDSFVDGALVASVLGSGPDADITLTILHDDAVLLTTGELDANAAFMQGRIKTTGPTGPLLDLLAMVGGTDARSVLRDLAASTEF